MASDQIMIYDQIKLKVFESGIFWGTIKNAKIIDLERLRIKRLHK